MIRVFAVLDCQYTLPGDSREAKDIENAVKRQTWDLNDLDRAVSISQILKVDNPNLEREYHEKKAELRHNGRSLKELSEQLAFCVETEESRVKEICRSGLECSGVDHTLGDGDMGVTVWKCPDLCLKALHWPSSRSACLIVFKVSNVCCIVTLLLYNYNCSVLGDFQQGEHGNWFLQELTGFFLFRPKLQKISIRNPTEQNFFVRFDQNF